MCVLMRFVSAVTHIGTLVSWVKTLTPYVCITICLSIYLPVGTRSYLRDLVVVAVVTRSYCTNIRVKTSVWSIRLETELLDDTVILFSFVKKHQAIFPGGWSISQYGLVILYLSLNLTCFLPPTFPRVELPTPGYYALPSMHPEQLLLPTWLKRTFTFLTTEKLEGEKLSFHLTF